MKGGSDHDNVENGVTHGATVLMELVLPWVNTHKIVCADSYFVSVTASELIYPNGLKFIEVVKKATRKYLLTHLSTQELGRRGYMYGLFNRKTIPYVCYLLAYVCMDEDCRYFIASGYSMDAGDNMERIRSCQIEDVSKNVDPVDITLTIPQPKASEIYYGA